MKREIDEDEGIDLMNDYVPSINIRDIVETIPANYRDIFTLNISIVADSPVFITPWDSIDVKTNINLSTVHAKCYMIVKEESAMGGASKRGLTLKGGLLGPNCTGCLTVKLSNTNGDGVFLPAGTKIGVLSIKPYQC